MPGNALYEIFPYLGFMSPFSKSRHPADEIFKNPCTLFRSKREWQAADRKSGPSERIDLEPALSEKFLMQFENQSILGFQLQQQWHFVFEEPD